MFGHDGEDETAQEGEDNRVMNKGIRVRFAPSPTGHLHIGGARTALFNWLFARHHGGTFVLRIEDTDRSRSTDEYIEAILEGMKWLELHWDEGPYRQTDRYDIYNAYAQRLLEKGRAYRCYCTPEELEQRRQEAITQGRSYRYDGRCREAVNQDQSSSKTYAIRFRMQDTGSTFVHDLIRGSVEFDNSQLEDLIIVRSDGSPTYNFCVVVDDIDMEITHVIRGDDHLNNTPKQIQICDAFGWEPPRFAHLPMILGSDKARLSKRHGATSVMAYREMGYLPEALVNYLVRLGWSHGDQEVFAKQELIEHFSFDTVGKSSAVFNPEKLLWLNSQYIIRSEPRALSERLMPYLEAEGIDTQRLDKGWIHRAVPLLQERARTLVELARSLKIYIVDPVEIDRKAADKFLKPENLQILKVLQERLSCLEDFNVAAIEGLFKGLAQETNLKLKDIAQPARVALTGSTASPGLFEIIELIGKERVLSRISAVLGGADDAFK